MLRKITIAIAGTLLVSGMAVATASATETAPTFPTSISEINPWLPAYSAANGAVGATTGAGAFGEVQTPSSVPDVMPEMAGGQSHPTMQGARAGTRAYVAPRNVPAWPASVNESNPSAR